MVCYVFSRLFMPPAFSFRAKLPAYDAFFPLSYFYDKRYSFSQNAISYQNVCVQLQYHVVRVGEVKEQTVIQLY